MDLKQLCRLLAARVLMSSPPKCLTTSAGAWNLKKCLRCPLGVLRLIELNLQNHIYLRFVAASLAVTLPNLLFPSVFAGVSTSKGFLFSFKAKTASLGTRISSLRTFLAGFELVTCINLHIRNWNSVPVGAPHA
jgi:hypothetical protein